MPIPLGIGNKKGSPAFDISQRTLYFNSCETARLKLLFKNMLLQAFDKICQG